MPALPHSGGGSARHVHILMCTYNGAPYLQAQLNSFLAQDHDAWSLWVSDDNSSDNTRDILSRFQADHPDRDIRILQGPCKGPAANFMSLLTHQDLPETTVALSDQDDVWLPHKLSRALAQIDAHSQSSAGQNPSPPVVYSCGSLRVDTDLTPLDAAPLPRHGPSFTNALVQNILPGNCIVLPPAALALVRQSPPLAMQVPFHDWWIYLLLTGAGARIILDPEPGIQYRQHQENVLGANRGLQAARARLKLVRHHQYRGWIKANLAALQAASPCLTAENRALLEAALKAFDGPGGLTRARALHRLGIRRQTPRENLFLYGLVLCGWV